MDDLTGGGRFQPTHTVPESGLGAWAEPDGSQPVAAWLQAGTEVHVDEWRGAWARALFSNGWQAWVDGRQLQPGGAAVLVLIGSFLPWISLGPFSASGWDVSVGYLITGKGVVGGLKVGFVLLAVVLIGLPALTHRSLPPWIVPTVAGVAVAASGITLVRA